MPLPGGQLRAVPYFLCAALLVGLGGLAVQAAVYPTAVPLCSGLWMAAMIAFHAAYTLRLLWWPVTATAWPRITWYSSLVLTGVACLLVLGWAAGHRGDAAAWAAVLTAVLGVRVVLLREWHSWLAKHGPDHHELLNSTGTIAPSDLGTVSLLHRGTADAPVHDKPAGGCCRGTVHGLHACAQILAFVIMTLLGMGCWLQTVGYLVAAPQGSFVSITLPSGQTQRILTQCVGAASGPNVTTIWVEVGGGGHAMSDLWGMRDYFALHFPRYRHCSYDMPGTGTRGCTGVVHRPLTLWLWS